VVTCLMMMLNTIYFFLLYSYWNHQFDIFIWPRWFILSRRFNESKQPFPCLISGTEENRLYWDCETNCLVGAGTSCQLVREKAVVLEPIFLLRIIYLRSRRDDLYFHCEINMRISVRHIKVSEWVTVGGTYRAKS
jgi:hypothetical protein